MGVTLDILEKEYKPEEESNFKPLNVKGKGGASWFQELDFELEKDMKSMGTGIEGTGAIVNGDGANGDGPRIVNGKLVNKEQQQGVRVGSAVCATRVRVRSENEC